MIRQRKLTNVFILVILLTPLLNSTNCCGQAARAEGPPAPLARGCRRYFPLDDDPPACCVYGYVYHDDAPVAGAEVHVESPHGALDTTTAVGEAGSAPYYAAGLSDAPLLASPGDVITITASYGGMSSIRTWTVQGDGQQVDVGLVPGYQSPGTSVQAGAAPGPEALQSPGWWATVQDDIQRSEYHVTWQDQTYLEDVPAAYQAPNRAQNLRAYFTPAGIRVVPRAFAGEAPPWEWGLALTGYGYAGEVRPVGAAEPLPSANRIEYRYESASQRISERYVNDERGLEQGFTLASPPLSSSPGPLVLELALSGDLTPNMADDGSAIELTTPGGVRVLRYDSLRAVDATSRELPTRLQLTPSRTTFHVSRPMQHALRITIDASAATYPLTLTPLLTSPGWTAEGEQAEAYFGNSVSTAGDVNGDGYADAVVGAYLYDGGQMDEGRALVYYGSATGLSSVANWSVEGDQAGAKLGNAVGTAGDVNGDGYADIIIGALDYDDGQTDEGRVFVYHGSSTGLGATADWTAEADQASTNFGSSVGAAGDVNGDGYADVIVGAFRYDGGQTDEGRVYVYTGSATGLAATAHWTVEGDQSYAYFGNAVGTAGDVNGDGYADVIVGAHTYDSGQYDEGKVFVYHGSSSGLTTMTADWTAESNQAESRFGYSAGTAGDVDGDGYADVIVGAYGYGDGQTGRVYVYVGAASGLSSSADWIVDSDQIDSRLGRSVGTAGDVNGDGYADVIVGAPTYNNGQYEEGQAYIYYGSEDGLDQVSDWMAESNQADAYFGIWVGTAGDVNGDGYADVIVGASRYDNGQADEGRAFVYHGSPDSMSTTADWTTEGNQVSGKFGARVGTAGDVNGDGYADVIIGVHWYDDGETDEGRAFIYQGSKDGLGTTPVWTVEGGQAYAYFGVSAGTAGDVNGDGYADVIVGAYTYDNGQLNEGRVYVYHGSASGPSTTADWTAESDQAEARFGISAGTAGDVNGDGYADVVVGAFMHSNGQTEEGGAFVYHGSASGLSVAADWTAESDQAESKFGWSVGTAGDVNGDGYTDVIVGACYYDGGQTDEGRVFVYYGSASGLSTSANWTAEGNQAGAYFGNSVGTAGDVNGNGYADVIVGAPRYTNNQSEEGRGFVYHGSASGLSTLADWTAESDRADAYFGFSVGTAGDVNGDGYADVVVGAREYDNGQVEEGRAFVYHGSTDGLSMTPGWTAEGNQAYAHFGYWTGTAGDVNGDGYADVIIGAPAYDNGQFDEGRAFLYYGNGGDGLHLLPRQMRTDGSAPIAPGGLSDSSTAVQIGLTGRMPLGRERVKLQYQVAPLGMSFDAATGVIEGTSAAWTDVLTTGVAITETVTGLAPGTPYHWRARLLYAPGNALGQSASRWVHMPWNGWNETDFRTPGPPPPAYGTATLLLEDIGGGITVELTSDLESLGHFSILEEDGTYYLWINNGIYPSYGMEQRLESQDGLIWRNRTDTNLTGPPGAYMRLEGMRRVIKSDDVYEGWIQYYYEWTEGWAHANMYVTSTNGITWTIVNQPALIGSLGADVIKEEGVYHMWATTDVDPQISSVPRILRHRTSTDGGTGWGHWQTGGEMVTVDGHELTLPIINVRKLADGTYQLFYHAYRHPQVNLVTSLDGVHFTTAISNLLHLQDVLPPGSTLDFVDNFTVVEVEGEDWFYFRFRDQEGVDHLAVSRPVGSGEPVPPSSVAITDPATCILNVPCTFAADVTPNTATTPITYVWHATEQISVTHTGGISDVVTFTWSTTGTHHITVTASNSIGAVAAATAIDVADYPAPDADFTAAPLSGTVPLDVQFTDLSTGSITSWDWTFGDGGVSGARHPGHTYTTDGVYTVSLTVSGPGGSDTEVKTGYITVVFLPPTATIDAIAPNPATQGQDTIYFSGSGQDGDEGGDYIAAYVWTSNMDGQLGTQPEFTIQASALSTGTHTISFKVQDDEGEWSQEVTRTLTVQEGQPSVRTLILVNRQKLETLYSGSEADQVMGKLDELAAHPSVQGMVVQVEDDPAVAAAYAVWDAHPTHTNKANSVAEAIKTLIDAHWAGHPDLEYLVVVGDDRVIPFRRVRDMTYYPESHYGPVSPDSTVGAALQDDMTLTDDYYADEIPVVIDDPPWGGHPVYIPDLGIGRLIETPSEIIAQIDAFLAEDGAVADDAIVTGYALVEDSAQAMCSELGGDGIATDCTLIGDSWDAGQFVSSVLNTRHDIVSINGHTNHYIIGAPSGYVSSDDVALATADHTRAVFYSVGCHGGLNVPPTNPYQPLDTAQAVIQNEAIYVSNTGYGWGYISSIGLSEQLMLDFTERLVYGQSTTVGQALVAAKQEYYLADGHFDYYDEKILLESTLYGLPMFRYVTPATLAAQEEPAVVIEGQMSTLGNGLTVNSLSYQFPTLLAESTEDGQYYTFGGQVHSGDGQPIQPKYVADLSFPETHAHGIVFNGGLYADVPSFDPVVDRAITETAALEPAFGALGWYPVLPYQLNSLGQSSRLVAILGQFNPQSQTERVYERLSFDIYYHTTSDDWTAPSLTRMSSLPEAENTLVTVEASDDSGIHTVVIAYTDGDGTWASTSLVQSGGSWSGRFPTGAGTRFFVQVVDQAGNVTVEDNGGQYFVPGDGSLKYYLPLALKSP